MRKSTLNLVLLFCFLAVGAMAGVTPKVTRIAAASELADGFYFIKNINRNNLDRQGYAYMGAGYELLIKTDTSAVNVSSLMSDAVSADYVWHLTKDANGLWNIEGANGTHRFWGAPPSSGNMAAVASAAAYQITDHSSGVGLEMKSGNNYINSNKGHVSGWSNGHQMELYRIENAEEVSVEMTYQLQDGTALGTVEVNIPSCKSVTELTAKANAPENYTVRSVNGTVVTMNGRPLVNGKTYCIESDNFLNGADVRYALYYNGTNLGLKQGLESSSAAYMWTCVYSEEGYTFRNVESGKWLAFKTVSDTPYSFRIDPSAAVNEGCLPLYAINNSRYICVKNDGSSFDQATSTFNKNKTNFTSDFIFTECEAPENAYFSQSIENPVWLRVINSRNKSYALTAREGDKQGTSLHSATSDMGADGQLFALVGSMAEGFYIYNKVLGQEYTLTAQNTNSGTAVVWKQGEPSTKWYLVNTYLTAAQSAGYVLTTNPEGTTSMNMHGGVGHDIKFYDAADGGSRWLLSVVDSEPTVIHYSVVGEKKYNDANQWLGVLSIQKGSFQSSTYVTADANGTVFHAYLPKSDDPISFSNYDLHGWLFSHEQRDGEHYITYTADQQTESQYLGFRPDAEWYRIPAIQSANNGDVVAVFDWRVCHSDVGFGEVDQKMRRSSDFGETWTEEEVISDGKGGSDNVFGVAFGDPALAADRESGAMALVTVSGKCIYAYGNATNHPFVAVQFSQDNGKTWSEPEDITSQFWGKAGAIFQNAETEDGGNVHAYAGFFGSGKILQSRKVKIGDYYRLYAAMLMRGKNLAGAYVVYSDDMGHTWKLLGGDNKVQAASNSDEPKVEELPNGDVVLSGRKWNGRVFNIWHWTKLPTEANTYGSGKWGTAQNSNNTAGGISVGANSCNGEILYVECKKADGTDAKLMLQSLPAGDNSIHAYSGRAQVEIWYKDITDPSSYASVDAFARNWTRGLRLTEDIAAYSTMTVQQDGRIGFFYEEGPCVFTLVYVPLTIEKITNNQYKELNVDDLVGVSPFEQQASSCKEVGSIFSSDGKRMASPQKGVNILKMTDGTARKVVLR